MGQSSGTAVQTARAIHKLPKHEPGRYYRPELDVVRFLAFAAVFLHHDFPAHTPFLRALQSSFAFGMCLFFFLSSFLITELLQREKASTGGVHIKAFYVRRILRIWPLYFGFLLFGVLFGLLVPAVKVSMSLLLSFIFLAGNWWVSVHGFPVTPIGVLWSISLEEQFYLTWPFLNKFGKRRVVAIACTLLVFAAMLAEAILARTQHPSVVSIWVNSFVQFQFFAMGALLSLSLAGKTPKLSNASRAAMLASALVLYFLAAKIFRIISFSPPPSSFEVICGYTLVGIACTLLICAVLGVSAQYIPKPLIYLGKISYGLYVFHGLCTGLSRGLVATLQHQGSWLAAHSMLASVLRGGIGFAMTVMLAALSYRYFESPFLKLKERFAFVQSRSV